MSAHNGLDTVLKLGIRAVIKTESLLRRSQPSNWRLVPVTRRDVQIPGIRESALSANQVLPQQGRRRRRPGRGSGYLKAEGGRDRRSRGARRTEGSGGQSQEVQHGSRQTGGGYAKRYRSLTAFSAWRGHHHPASEASRRWPRCGFKLRSRWRLPHQPIRSREDASCYQEVGGGRGGTLRRTGVGVARRAQLTQPGGKGRGLE